jgi:hypothetical protein
MNWAFLMKFASPDHTPGQVILVGEEMGNSLARFSAQQSVEARELGKNSRETTIEQSAKRLRKCLLPENVANQTGVWGEFVGLLLLRSFATLRNLARNLRGVCGFYRAVWVSPLQVPLHLYLLWQDGFSRTGARAPAGLSRSVLSPNKQLVFLGRQLKLPAWKPNFGRYLGAVDFAAYQRRRSLLFFDMATETVFQEILDTKNSAEFETVVALSGIFPNPLDKENSTPSRLVMRLVWGPNLSQVEARIKFSCIERLLRCSAAQTGTHIQIERVNRLFDEFLALGDHVGPETEMLASLASSPIARMMFGGVPWVPSHGDLNLFNVIVENDNDPNVIDFDVHKIQFMPRWFDPLILIRQCGAKQYFDGQFDELLARMFWLPEGVAKSPNFLEDFRSEIFALAMALEAPSCGSPWKLAPEGLEALERELTGSRIRFASS